MNCFAAYPRPLPGGGFWAMIRLARDARPKPIMDKGERPVIYPTELEAQKACTKHLLAYFNGDLRRDGKTISARLSAAEALFPGLTKPTLVRQKGSSRFTKVETVRKRA